MVGKDPEWTEKLSSGRIIDPLQLNTFRNRMLTDLMWGVVSIQIYQRLRYISFSLWCLNNLEDPSRQDLVPFEKIFLLANIAHSHHNAKDRGENGLSGAGNVPYDQNDFHDGANSTFSISDEAFQIQDSGSSGFSSYYQSIMERLLLIDGLTPTPLGQDVAEAFEEEVNVEFEDLSKAVERGEVNRELILDFTKACSCLLNGREEELLKKAYFGLVSSEKMYGSLSWSRLEESKRLKIENDSVDSIMRFLEVDEVNNIDEYLKRYFSGSYGAKMRDSFLLFLWIADQDRDHSSSLSNVEELRDIHKLWRLYRYYDFFNYGVEALLTAVLRNLKSKEDSVHPRDLLSEIVNNEEYGRTVNAVLAGIEDRETNSDQDGLKRAFQYIYYGEARPNKSEISHIDIEKVDEEFTESWPNLLEEIEGSINVSKFSVDAEISEWKLKRLIGGEVNNPKGSNLDSSSRIFAYTTVLMGLLKLRHENIFDRENHRPFWNWFTKFEKQPPGPVSLLQSLDSNRDLQEFMQQFVKKWAIVQYNEALYEKMDTSRMPRLFSKDYTGKIDYQESWHPGLSKTKFDRMADIFFDLGLLEEPSTETFEITTKGENWLSRFMEVDR